MDRYQAARSTTITIRNWADLVRNSADLQSLYTDTPSLTDLTVRSIHLNHFGPCLTLRIDLPVFPQNPPPEWVDAGLDQFQCHLEFIAIENLELKGWIPHGHASLELHMHNHNKILARMESDGFHLSFVATDSILVGHMSAYRALPNGSDGGPHQFVRKLDTKKYDAIPPVHEKTFYEHI
ncbi:Imm50 family immunity protein [Streptomyces sp. WMMC940]|uniref:Imm50 family immunity protein n=1 Tax=Streptomyces sp. WMMC940 TaxID=3015153 RepID=UPI0022B63143|nr:Imm50 family immunity protein [Streptomyces sp. WMMC940]MCZ7459681.1 Imm50 family immunity protein [Streptomyces sp. WMMC940]